MRFEKIYFDQNHTDAFLTLYVSDVKSPVRDAMLVIPGGGYGCVCSDREGEPIALAYLARGMNAFVLHYTVTPSDPYIPLMEASLAMAYIREHAEELAINPKRVFAVGFSAGGHLAASLATMWNDDVLNSRLSIPQGANRPDGAVLCYAIITPEGHFGSFQNLLGTQIDNPETLHAFTLNERVSADTPPTFLVHTANDDVVPVEKNALVMADALTKAKIPYELHIYPFGPHGMALANSDTSNAYPPLEDQAYARWVDDSITFFARF